MFSRGRMRGACRRRGCSQVLGVTTVPLLPSAQAGGKRRSGSPEPEAWSQKPTTSVPMKLSVRSFASRFLDPDVQADIIAQKLRQAGVLPVAPELRRGTCDREVCASKKLYRYRPGSEPPGSRSRPSWTRTKPVLVDPAHRAWRATVFCRQGHGEPGRYLPLLPELLRLGAWDLLCGWTGQPPRQRGPGLGVATHLTRRSAVLHRIAIAAP